MSRVDPALRDDPDFRPVLDPRTVADAPDPGAYRRAIANPFLALLAGIGWWCFVMAADPDLPLIHVVSAGAVLLALPRLLHYHCLDCGGTGRIGAWKRHVCPAVARRVVARRRRRLRGLPPLLQLVAWAYAIVVAGAAAWHSR